MDQHSPPQLRWHLGVRGRAALLVAALALCALGVALVAGITVIDRLQHRLAQSYATEHASFNRERLQAPIGRELALARKLADSELTRQFLLDEDNPELRRQFFAEAESFRQLFADNSYFIASARSRYFYFNDNLLPYSDAARYQLDFNKADDAWFTRTLLGQRPYQSNVSRDANIGASKLWFNIQVKDGGQPLGVIGTGLTLEHFLKAFSQHNQAGVSSMLVNDKGAIQAHPDRRRIEYMADGKRDNTQTVFRYLGSANDARQLRSAMQRVNSGHSRVETLSATLDGKPQLLAVAWLPELQWYHISAVDPDAMQGRDYALLWGTVIAIVLLICLTLFVLILSIDRQLLQPLTRLTAAVRHMAAGDYRTPVDISRRDEIGQLADACRQLASQVDSHTHELEARVDARTRELSLAHDAMAETNRKLGDSIRYASLIQQGILPQAALAQTLPGRHMLLWQPRDVVSGDLYVFVPQQDGYLFGLIDCAGHGVSGALMTMLAHAALCSALDGAGAHDPARLLHGMDEAVRSRFATGVAGGVISTTMDAALCRVDTRAGTLTFAGAHMDLYLCRNDGVEVIRGARRALGERRTSEAANHTLALQAQLGAYLSSDGLLDQTGGDAGYGFGRRRFEAALLSLQTLPWPARGARLEQLLSDYRQGRAQVDDIAVFGVDASLPAS